LLGYVEAHIEQGPVLESENLAVGVVTGIGGQSRAKITFAGSAGHAGTVPMHLRKDALCAAAEFILAAENLAKKNIALVATVGELSVKPGASNVIPAEARLTLDLRHAKDSIRRSALKQLKQAALKIAARRRIRLIWENVHETRAVDCSKKLSAELKLSAWQRQKRILQLPSGAGHDAAIMSKVCPVAMLFIRCKGGITHRPDESVRVDDVRLALGVLSDFILRLAKIHERL
jgi:allantoate deiminase